MRAIDDAASDARTTEAFKRVPYFALLPREPSLHLAVPLHVGYLRTVAC